MCHDWNFGGIASDAHNAMKTVSDKLTKET